MDGRKRIRRVVGDQQHQTIGWLPECVCPRTVLARLCAKAEVKGRPADLAEISPPREETAPDRGTRRPEVSGRNPVNCAAETFPRGQDKSYVSHFSCSGYPDQQHHKINTLHQRRHHRCSSGRIVRQEQQPSNHYLSGATTG